MTIRRILGTCAVAMVAALSGGGVWLGGAGTALAPEPARTNGALYSNGSVTSANYITTGGTTNAWRWTSSWAASSSMPVGAPCSTGPVSAGTTLTTVIVAAAPGSPYKSCR
jgi:hypothetical protein